MNDIILRDCGSVGWLGVLERGGEEIYRTGKHYQTSQEAHDRVVMRIETGK